MTSFRLALSELKRMSSGRLPRLAIVALTLVPLLYGALYLYANWDPYSRMGEVRAAIVNLDAGASRHGGDLHVGDDVTGELLEDGSFGWVVVGSAAEAEAGVASGDYAFALTIPANFSANLASPEDLTDTRQAMLSVTTNDANNYMVGTFADRLAVTVRDTVAAEVGTQTADALLAGFGDIHTAMVEASDGASDLYAGTVTLANGAAGLSSGAAEVDAGAQRLADGARQVNDGAATLADGSTAVGDGGRQGRRRRGRRRHGGRTAGRRRLAALHRTGGAGRRRGRARHGGRAGFQGRGLARRRARDPPGQDEGPARGRQGTGRRRQGGCRGHRAAGPGGCLGRRRHREVGRGPAGPGAGDEGRRNRPRGGGGRHAGRRRHPDPGPGVRPLHADRR